MEPFNVPEATGGNWWWDGYRWQRFVIADDFRKDFCKFPQLLRMLDKYEFQVQVKGGYVQLLAKVIVITCAFHPTELYDGINEDVNQLLRRIDVVRHFTERYSPQSAAELERNPGGERQRADIRGPAAGRQPQGVAMGSEGLPVDLVGMVYKPPGKYD